MIQDEWLIRKALNQLDRCGELPRIDEQIVGQIEFLQTADSLDESSADEEAVIGLILGDVTNADEFRMR